jgi:hypothetical protein
MVDLPEPDDPIIDTNSPSLIFISMLFNTFIELLPIEYDLLMLFNSIIISSIVNTILPIELITGLLLA